MSRRDYYHPPADPPRLPGDPREEERQRLNREWAEYSQLIGDTADPSDNASKEQGPIPLRDTNT